MPLYLKTVTSTAVFLFRSLLVNNRVLSFVCFDISGSQCLFYSGEKVINLSDLNLNKHQEGQVVKTDAGKEINADIVIPCTGTKPNNAFYKEALGEFLWLPKKPKLKNFVAIFQFYFGV